MTQLIKDSYRKTRGSWSRILSLKCKSCNHFLFLYQKDGPGPLKRSYLDRIKNAKVDFDANGYYCCPKCLTKLGFKDIYTKENGRPIIRWAVDAINYQIVKA